MREENNYGYYLKVIREGKKISISKLAQKSQISKSQISRFERGESEISFSKMMVLLDSLNVSLEEYESIFSSECHIASIKKKMSKIKYAAKSQDTLELGKEVRKLKEGLSIDPFTDILIKSIMHYLDESITPSLHDIEILTDYLFKIEFWTYYEIMLLGNVVRFINLNTLFLLTKELLKSSYEAYAESPYNKKMIIQLTLNCAIACIDNHQISRASYLLKAIEIAVNEEYYFFEKSIFLYVTGYLEYEQKNKNGISKMKNALKIFEILDKDGLYNIYIDHFKKIIN